MDRQAEHLIRFIQELVPSKERKEFEDLVSQMSQRTGISMEDLWAGLYEDLQLKIPFRYTAVGRSWTMTRL